MLTIEEIAKRWEREGRGRRESQDLPPELRDVPESMACNTSSQPPQPPVVTVEDLKRNAGGAAHLRRMGSAPSTYQEALSAPASPRSRVPTSALPPCGRKGNEISAHMCGARAKETEPHEPGRPPSSSRPPPVRRWNSTGMGGWQDKKREATPANGTDAPNASVNAARARFWRQVSELSEGLVAPSQPVSVPASPRNSDGQEMKPVQEQQQTKGKGEREIDSVHLPPRTSDSGPVVRTRPSVRRWNSDQVCSSSADNSYQATPPKLPAATPAAPQGENVRSLRERFWRQVSELSEGRVAHPAAVSSDAPVGVLPNAAGVVPFSPISGSSAEAPTTDQMMRRWNSMGESPHRELPPELQSVPESMNINRNPTPPPAPVITVEGLSKAWTQNQQNTGGAKKPVVSLSRPSSNPRRRVYRQTSAPLQAGTDPKEQPNPLPSQSGQITKEPNEEDVPKPSNIQAPEESGSPAGQTHQTSAALQNFPGPGAPPHPRPPNQCGAAAPRRPSPHHLTRRPSSHERPPPPPTSSLQSRRPPSRPISRQGTSEDPGQANQTTMLGGSQTQQTEWKLPPLPSRCSSPAHSRRCS
uniref:Uncharacterized protein n=1 Tax=Chromera velia CCMP2878 TaxID=1169474 RepID=A0A0G4F8Y7_9ALVE|eukprot:Cvel_15827.t1-p1 / transcript=Cvel_15827.t1 / gene=Cvel_15827 / organism=Chromera_velia_CCMP2878 / gene_product=hypothetical protein / transcript_product=hypothetical protein / location=Cvel_scaffold1189:32206-33954(+) / protein_length=583 / sequence_SO=supercontig / SO=protein_coding / is_pseudo=false